MTNVKELLTLHEGVRLRPYRDSVGKLTIGIGHNLDDLGISRSVASHLLDEDLAHAIKGARLYSWFDELSDVRQAVIVDMIFNMGRGSFRGFKKFKRALSRRNYYEASLEMKNSKWFRQVGRRGIRLCAMMHTDEWPRRH